MNSPGCSDVRPGPICDRLDRLFAPPCRPDDHATRPRCDQRRHAVGRRRGVAEVAAQRGAALDLGRADQVGRLDHARPGADQRGILADRRARCRRADGEAAVRTPPDADRAGDALQVHHRARAQPPGAHLHDQVGAAGQNAGGGRAAQHFDRLIDAGGRHIVELRHAASFGGCRPDIGSASMQLSERCLPEAMGRARITSPDQRRRRSGAQAMPASPSLRRVHCGAQRRTSALAWEWRRRASRGRRSRV